MTLPFFFTSCQKLSTLKKNDLIPVKHCVSGLIAICNSRLIRVVYTAATNLVYPNADKHVKFVLRVMIDD